MHDSSNPNAVPKRIPWNKGKLIGPRPPLRQNMFGRSGPDSRWSSRYESWRCSIWRSTASCGAVTLSPSELTTLPRMDTQSSERLSGKENRPTGPVRADRTDPTGDQRVVSSDR